MSPCGCHGFPCRSRSLTRNSARLRAGESPSWPARGESGVGRCLWPQHRPLDSQITSRVPRQDPGSSSSWSSHSPHLPNPESRSWLQVPWPGPHVAEGQVLNQVLFTVHRRLSPLVGNGSFQQQAAIFSRPSAPQLLENRFSISKLNADLSFVLRDDSISFLESVMMSCTGAGESHCRKPPMILWWDADLSQTGSWVTIFADRAQLSPRRPSFPPPYVQITSCLPVGLQAPFILRDKLAYFRKSNEMTQSVKCLLCKQEI